MKVLDMKAFLCFSDINTHFYNSFEYAFAFISVPKNAFIPLYIFFLLITEADFFICPLSGTVI